MASSSRAVLQVARRYATALFEYAVEKKALEAVEKDLNTLGEFLAGSDELKRFINSPSIKRNAQENTIIKILEQAKAHKVLIQFGALLARKRRLAALPQIVTIFSQLAQEHRGEGQAEVISAHELDKAQLENIKTSLDKVLGKTMNLTSTVNPSIQGGLIIKMGSHMLDDSLKSKLERIRLSTKKAVAAL